MEYPLPSIGKASIQTNNQSLVDEIYWVFPAYTFHQVGVVLKDSREKLNADKTDIPTKSWDNQIETHNFWWPSSSDFKECAFRLRNFANMIFQQSRQVFNGAESKIFTSLIVIYVCKRCNARHCLTLNTLMFWATFTTLVCKSVQMTSKKLDLYNNRFLLLSKFIDYRFCKIIFLKFEKSTVGKHVFSGGIRGGEGQLKEKSRKPLPWVWLA